MHFFYDAQSCPAMVEFNGALYSYVHNLQGDVVGIVDSAGSLVVEYKYDAWGKPTLVRTLTTAYEALAELNPFRYRGYVWDEETGLYYLRSRYYAPKKNRFINADTTILTHNQFIYCANSPNNLQDDDGNLWQGAMHYQVQCRLSTPERIREVQVIKAGGGRGRIDLACPATGECWEVKPYHSYSAGAAQLTRYIYGTVIDKRWRLVQPRRGRFLPGGYIPYEGYLIHYWYAGGGVILYEYEKLEKSTEPELAPEHAPALEPEAARDPIIIVPAPFPERQRVPGLIPNYDYDSDFSVGDAILSLLFIVFSGGSSAVPVF